MLLCGCGAAHIKKITDAYNLGNYKNIYVADVSVNSTEQKEDLVALNESFSKDAKEEIIRTLEKKTNYLLIDKPDQNVNQTLIIETEIKIAYGNRALRYFVGFGAGKGSVVSTLRVKDNVSGGIKLELVSESDLAVGIFGGDMRQVVKENIKKLADQLEKEL